MDCRPCLKTVFKQIPPFCGASHTWSCVEICRRCTQPVLSDDPVCSIETPASKTYSLSPRGLVGCLICSGCVLQAQDQLTAQLQQLQLREAAKAAMLAAEQPEVTPAAAVFRLC